MSIITVRGVMFASLSAVVALANVAVAVPAHAAAPEAPTALVRYADLDLATAGGVARLDRRIRAAVTDVCGAADIRDLVQGAAVHRCRVAALADAAPQLASAIASARNGTKVAATYSLRVASR